MAREDWTFSTYMNEVIYLSEITEVPGATGLLTELLKEMKEKFPEDAKELGLE